MHSDEFRSVYIIYHILLVGAHSNFLTFHISILTIRFRHTPVCLDQAGYQHTESATPGSIMLNCIPRSTAGRRQLKSIKRALQLLRIGKDSQQTLDIRIFQ
jgi:hypothetical protein